jgi:hypothetical protein
MLFLLYFQNSHQLIDAFDELGHQGSSTTFISIFDLYLVSPGGPNCYSLIDGFFPGHKQWLFAVPCC